MPSCRGGLSANPLNITEVRDIEIVNIVVPAKAGTQCLGQTPLDPRLRGDDVSILEAVTQLRKPQ